MHYHQTIFAKPVIPTLPTTMANVWHKLDVWMFTNQIQETRHVLHAEIIFIMFTNIITIFVTVWVDTLRLLTLYRQENVFRFVGMVSWFYQIKNVMTQTLSSMMVVTVTVVLKKTSNVHKNRHQNVSCTKTSSSLSSCTCKESSVKTKAFCTSWSNLNNLVSQTLIGPKSWVSTSPRLLSIFPNSVTSTSLKEGNFWSQYLTVKT